MKRNGGCCWSRSRHSRSHLSTQLSLSTRLSDLPQSAVVQGGRAPERADMGEDA